MELDGVEVCHGGILLDALQSSQSFCAAVVGNYVADALQLPVIAELRCASQPPLAILDGGQPARALRILGNERVCVLLSETQLQNRDVSCIFTLLFAFAERHHLSSIVSIQGLIGPVTPLAKPADTDEETQEATTAHKTKGEVTRSSDGEDEREDASNEAAASEVKPKGTEGESVTGGNIGNGEHNEKGRGNALGNAPCTSEQSQTSSQADSRANQTCACKVCCGVALACAVCSPPSRRGHHRHHRATSSAGTPSDDKGKARKEREQQSRAAKEEDEPNPADEYLDLAASAAEALEQTGQSAASPSPPGPASTTESTATTEEGSDSDEDTHGSTTVPVERTLRYVTTNETLFHELQDIGHVPIGMASVHGSAAEVLCRGQFSHLDVTVSISVSRNSDGKDAWRQRCERLAAVAIPPRAHPHPTMLTCVCARRVGMVAV